MFLIFAGQNNIVNYLDEIMKAKEQSFVPAEKKLSSDVCVFCLHTSIMHFVIISCRIFYSPTVSAQPLIPIFSTALLHIFLTIAFPEYLVVQTIFVQSVYTP